MKLLAIALTLAALAVSGAGSAAEVVFPSGSRIGLDPPPDMDVSQRFAGFESRSKSAVITAVEMPPEAFKDLSAGLNAENLQKQGLTMTSRETFAVGGGEAVLVEGSQAGNGGSLQKWLLVVGDPTVTALVIAQQLKLTDGAETGQAMRDALRTIAIRAPRALDEQVSALPFRLGDTAGFRPVRVMAGNALMLTDGPDDTIREVEQPAVTVAHSTAVPPRDQRDAFARAALRANTLLKDVSIERAQGFRQRGADWHEIVAKGVDAASGRPVVVSQAIRFAPDHYLRVFAMMRADDRDATLSRVRALSDAVEPK
ncbi:MAG TPA: hypothetical protein VFY72_06260 [Beijerinckiaceae bacterium]|nr:hypothetical protein [Beijerinckiaceae bacterium]